MWVGTYQNHSVAEIMDEFVWLNFVGSTAIIFNLYILVRVSVSVTDLLLLRTAVRLELSHSHRLFRIIFTPPLSLSLSLSLLLCVFLSLSSIPKPYPHPIPIHPQSWVLKVPLSSVSIQPLHFHLHFLISFFLLSINYSCGSLIIIMSFWLFWIESTITVVYG